MATGYWQVFDPQNGFTAIRADMLRRLNLAAVHERFFFENDMLVQLSLHDARVKDVAIPAKYGEEISKLSATRSLFTFPIAAVPPLLAAHLAQLRGARLSTR